jgi:hypothetical protein
MTLQTTGPISLQQVNVELGALKEFVWNKKLRDGMNIELNFTFNTI